MPNPKANQDEELTIEKLTELSRQQAARQAGEQMAVTSASDWRKKRQEGFIVRLPSGNTAKVVRKLDLIEMLRQGKLPNPLNKFIQKMMDGQDMSDIQKEMKEQDLLMLLEWVDDQAIAAMVEPRVMRRPEGVAESWEPPEGYIELTDLDMEDRMYLAGVAQGGPTQVGRFRAATTTAMEGVLGR